MTYEQEAKQKLAKEGIHENNPKYRDALYILTQKLQSEKSTKKFLGDNGIYKNNPHYNKLNSLLNI